MVLSWRTQARDHVPCQQLHVCAYSDSVLGVPMKFESRGQISLQKDLLSRSKSNDAYGEIQNNHGKLQSMWKLRVPYQSKHQSERNVL